MSSPHARLQLRQDAQDRVTVTEVGLHEVLEFSEPVVGLAAGYKRVIIATLGSVKIFTPDSISGSSSALASIDIRGALMGVHLAPTCLMLLCVGHAPQVRANHLTGHVGIHHRVRMDNAASCASRGDRLERSDARWVLDRNHRCTPMTER